MQLVGADSLFMQDNAYPRMVQWVLKFLEEVEIAPLEWPICSLDLNQIEHVWDSKTYTSKFVLPFKFSPYVENCLVRTGSNTTKRDSYVQ